MTNIAEEVQLYGWTIYSKHTAMESMVSTVYITIQQIILFVFLALQSNTCVVLFKKTHSEAIKKADFQLAFLPKIKSDVIFTSSLECALMASCGLAPEPGCVCP